MLLSEDFLANYGDFPESMVGLGIFVFLRTYSRWIEGQNRRETYKEVCKRVVEYSFSLYTGTNEQTREAEKMFDAMYHMRVFPSGRTMWIGGTEASIQNPMANFNCSFAVIDSFSAIVEGFYLLMCGSGFGFRVLPEDTEKLPYVNVDIVLANKPYNPKLPDERREDTVTFEGDGTFLIVVGDSKWGWVNALHYYFEAMQRMDIESIIINYDSVRPKGERLKTFGGKASGHGALRDMFRSIHRVLTRETDIMLSGVGPNKEGLYTNVGMASPLNVMDIMNYIGYGVVVGGVRRTSEITLFNINDQEILDAKIGLFDTTHKNYGKSNRFMSNNSVFFESKPDLETLKSIMSRVRESAEPGYINAESARKRRPNFNGVNPCAEILLDSKGLCNLSTINLMAHITEDGKLDEDLLHDSIEIAVKIGMRMTNVDLELPKWDQVQKRDRLIGVSMTGIMDALDTVNFDREEWLFTLDEAKTYARKVARKYAYEMRIPEPLLITCIKPEGTISQLPTVSSGVHRSFAPYYIRRVRITSTDTLARVMLDLGFTVYPETGQSKYTPQEFDTLSWVEKLEVLQHVDTWVIEFAVKTNAVKKSSEETALEQYQRYLEFQSNWSEHNTSITISVGNDEWETLTHAIHATWDEYVGVSFLPKDNAIYPLMPYEAITEEEYNARKVDVHNLYEVLTYYEKGDSSTDTIDPNCESGVCPIR